MARRYASIWFPYLLTDRMTRRYPNLKQAPFILAIGERGRMTVKAVNSIAESKGLQSGMVVADCRAILPSLQVYDYRVEEEEKILGALAEWMLRYTPVVAVDPPDGLILNISGCPHLWGGEEAYIEAITSKMKNYGYHTRIAVADTIGAAWAVCRYGSISIVAPGRQLDALLPLPPASLRIEASAAGRLHKLGIYHIRHVLKMPRPALRKRLGDAFLSRLDQALGQEIEAMQPICPIEPYQERLPSLEPIRTATGIEIALQKLLEQLCNRLATEEKGLRKAIFKCYRIDNNIQQIDISTGHPSRNIKHLFKLFEIKIAGIEPALGIELFILEAPVVEDTIIGQEAIWDAECAHNDVAVAELLDKIAGKFGAGVIRRYLPAEHYWPERSVKEAGSLYEQVTTAWRIDLPRPLQLLPVPEAIEVMVQLPDYPPVHFIYKKQLHKVSKADGPERIEQEWWITEGLYRDYYSVEDENGGRYWIFRSGAYNQTEPRWYIHGFFA